MHAIGDQGTFAMLVLICLGSWSGDIVGIDTGCHATVA